VRQLLAVAVLLALLPPLGAPAAQAQPRAWADNHPRLLVDPALLAALPDSIAADPAKAAAWAGMQSAASIYQNVPVDLVFGSNYGFAMAPSLGLTSLMAEEPLASAIRQKLMDATLLLLSAEDVYGGGDDLSAAIRLRTLLYMYDMIFGSASPAITAATLAEIRSYIVAMSNDFYFTKGLYNPYCSNHSIGIGAVLIQAELCLRDDWPGDPVLARARSVGEALIAKGLNDLLGTDGSYGEGGLYLTVVFRLLAPVYAAAQRLDGVVLWDSAKVEAAIEWAAYLTVPEGGGICLNRNDCSEYSRPFALHTTLWEWSQVAVADPRFARWLRDYTCGPHGFDFGSVADQPATLLWHRTGPQLPPHGFLPDERYFPVQGLYVLRRGWPGDPLAESLQFTLQAGKFWGGHWQEDVGHFTLRAFGERFGMDNGPSGVASETEAHSLPLVDGLGQHNAGESIGTDGTLTLVVDRGFCRVLKADMAPAYNGHSPFNDPDYPLPGTDWSWGYDGGNPLERAERWALVLPGTAPAMPAFYLLDDLRKDAQAHDYEWRQHFGESIGFSAAGGRYTLASANGRLDADLLWPAPTEASWSLGTYDNGNSDPNSRVLRVAQRAVDARYLWQWELLAPGVPSQPLSVQRFAGGLRATRGAAGARRELVAAWAPVLNEPGVLLAGRFGLVEEQAGAAARSLLVDGRELRLDGQLYIGIQPAGWACADSDTVWLSSPQLDFEIYAPAAVAVMAGDTPVSFAREGDYVVRGDWTTSPAGPAAPPAVWSLVGVAGAAPRLRVAGPGGAAVQVELFDLQGRRTRRLHEGPLTPGEHLLTWDGADARGHRCAAGLYFARLSAGGETRRARLLLLR